MAGNYKQIADHLRLKLQERVDKMKSILEQKNAIATANLYQGIEAHVVVYPDRIEGRITAPTDEDGEAYHEFVDKGVSGFTGGVQSSPFKFKSLGVGEEFEEKLANWMKAKYGEGVGWQPRDVEGRNSFYGLGVHIKKKGIRPTGFISDVLTDDTPKLLMADLTRKFGEDFFNRIGKAK